MKDHGKKGHGKKGKKNPLEFARRVISEYINDPEGVVPIVEQILQDIWMRPAIKTAELAIETFNHVMKVMIAEFPEQGYEYWRPPDVAKIDTAGPRWKKSVETLELLYTHPEE